MKEKKEKILIIERFYYNFREGFFDYLDDINVNFRLINATKSKGKVRVHENAKNKNYIEKVFYFFFGNSYVIFPFLFFRLIKIDPDVIISEGGQNTINNLSVYLYCLLFNKRYIIWDLGRGHANFKDTMFRRIYLSVYIFLLNKARFVYGYNSQSRKYYESLGINPEKIIILNNTIDTRKIKRLRGRPTPAKPDDFPVKNVGDYTFLIFVGSLVKSKNIEALAELMKMLGKNYYLILVGDGDSEYKAKLNKLFIGTNHFFAGYKKYEELPPYFKVSSFSVLPGLGGLAINLSMAFGVPVVCTKADGAEKDLVTNNITGYIYKDLEDARRYILSKNKEEWKAMGKKAENLLYREHSVENMMDKFVYYSGIG